MPSKPWRGRAVRWAIGGVAAAALCYTFPLFHVVRLTAAPAPTGITAFQPEAYARKFWDERLIGSAMHADDAALVLADIRRDPVAAGKKHARSVGLGGPYYYFISGSGWVVAAEKRTLGISLEAAGTKAEVMIETGEIFGNGIRDGTGLLSVDAFPDSRNFNALSAELNNLVESRILPALRGAAVGARVRFAGIAEVAGDEPGGEPLRIVPIVAEVQ